MKRPDEFVVVLRDFFTGLFKHTKAMFFALAVVFAGGLVYAMVANQNAEKAGLGRDALYKARVTLEKELKDIAVATAPAVPAPKAAAKGDKKAAEPPAPPAPTAETVQFKKFDVDAKLAGGVKGLKEVSVAFAGTRPGFEANLMLGDLYYDHGEAAKAVPHYVSAVDAAPSTFEKAMTLSALGYAQEASGKPTDAVAAYEKALNLGEAGLKGDLLLSMARAYEQAKDTVKAKATYDRILSQLPNTDHAKTAEALKGQLE